MALFKEGSQLDPMMPSSFLGFCGRNIGISTESCGGQDRRWLTVCQLSVVLIMMGLFHEPQCLDLRPVCVLSDQCEK